MQRKRVLNIILFDFQNGASEQFFEAEVIELATHFNYQHVNCVFAPSEGVINYLKILHIYHKGTSGPAKNGGEIHLVSSTNIIPLKQIDQIVDALALLSTMKIEWAHFGYGVQMRLIRAKSAELPSNIEVRFMWNISNVEVLRMYQNESANLFAHTSETEGLDMAIIEIQSFGIPAAMIGVGGGLDIVSDEAGRVLAPNADGAQIAQAMIHVLFSEMNIEDYRSEVHSVVWRFSTLDSITKTCSAA